MKKILFALILLPIMVIGQLTKDENLWILNSNMGIRYVPIDVPDGFFSSKIVNSDDKCFFNEWRRYLKDCNELIFDTINQSGTVKCELVPVKMNGKIVSYNTVPIDTIWNKCECREYKHYASSLAELTYGSNVSIGYVLTSNSLGYSEPEPAKNTFSIKRNKICKIKKRKATFEDFFERWCVEMKLIEMN